MPSIDQMTDLLSRLNPRLVARLEKHLRKIPAVRDKIEQDTGELIETLESELKPYRNEFPRLQALPDQGQKPEAVLETMLERGFLERVTEVGAYFKAALQNLADKHDFIKQVRGRGLILGMELEFAGENVRREMADQGFLFNCTKEKVLRFLPPLIIAEEEIDRLIIALERVLIANA